MNTTNTQDPIKRAISEAIGFEWTDGYLQTVNASDLLRLSAAIAALQPAAAQPQGEGRTIAERITAKIEAMTPEQLATFMQARARIAEWQVTNAQPQGDAREAFEAWADKTQPAYRRTSAAWIQEAWSIWQAASTQASEPSAASMTAARAAFFIERFKREEKLLGPNEQAALDFVLSVLAAPARAVEPLTDDDLVKIGRHKPSNTHPWGIGSTRQDYLRAVRDVLAAFCRKNGIGIPATTPTKTKGGEDHLKLHAIEELCQLGYTVKDGQLVPPDHLHKLMIAAGHPLAASHLWSDDGERCLKCGDKDWMGGPCSVPDAAATQGGEA